MIQHKASGFYDMCEPARDARPEEEIAEDRRKATLTVAAAARDAEDLRFLLDALGLSAEEGKVS